jgi:flagellar hook-associated protein 2
MMSDSIPGLVDGEDTYTHLAQIGIQTDPDQNGRWIIENSVLNAALKNDIEAVARLFVGDPDHEPVGSSGIAEQIRIKMTELTDDETGIANVLIDNYNGIIQQIDNKIAREEKRIALVRDRLEQKFARLEALLGELDGQSEYLESQLAKLPEMGKS